MRDSIVLFEPEGFFPNNLRPSNVTLKTRKAWRTNEKNRKSL